MKPSVISSIAIVMLVISGYIYAKQAAGYEALYSEFGGCTNDVQLCIDDITEHNKLGIPLFRFRLQVGGAENMSEEFLQHYIAAAARTMLYQLNPSANMLRKEKYRKYEYYSQFRADINPNNIAVSVYSKVGANRYWAFAIISEEKDKVISYVGEKKGSDIDLIESVCGLVTNRCQLKLK